MLIDVAIFVGLTAAGIAIGVSMTSSDVLTPLLGSLTLGLFAAAMVGIGHIAGGVLGTRFAAPTVAVVVFATWFLQLLGSLFGLPDIVRGLALTSHYGQPMVGVWDPAGIVLSIAIAVGGIAIGAWAFARRDLGT